MIELINCEKSYGNYTVFKNINFSFKPKTYWITGANGIGKSVLMRCMVGLENFTNGIVTGINGNTLYLPDTTVGDSWLTIDENIKLMFYYYGLCLDSNLLEEVKKRLGILDGAVLTSQVSLGTSLKIGLSLLFIRNYWDTIILDETLSHIDKDTQNIIMEELCLRSKEGSTIFITNHSTLPTTSFNDYFEELELSNNCLQSKNGG